MIGFIFLSVIVNTMVFRSKTTQPTSSTFFVFYKQVVRILVLLVCCLFPKSRIRCEEGMIPISELSRVDLPSLGIELNSDQLFNPAGISLVDGICRVNTCTGSFVSSQGLILTNHHCAYNAIQQASTPDRDLLTEGFQASALAEELPAQAYVVKVTESYLDVSQDVLSAVKADMDFLTRTKVIDRRCRELEAEAERQHPGFRAEVSEMFIGKTYFLFMYTYLRDVRLVFAPPSSVGNFGGEEDNWHWPRHTGDFALMRAYTSADGSSASYHPENVPYRPKRVVQVQPAGVNEGDTVFILGYPGRTVRHRSASFLEMEQNVRLPLVVDHYRWQIDVMTSTSQSDRAAQLKSMARIKSLANVEKRSRGQLQGMTRAGIVGQRRNEEALMMKFIQAEPARNSRFGNVLDRLESLYAEMGRSLPLEFELEQLRTAPRLAAAAWFLVDAAHERAKPDVDRELPYADKNYEQTLQTIQNSIRDFHSPTDQALLAGILSRIQTLMAGSGINTAGLESVHELVSDSDRAVAMIQSSRLQNLDFFQNCSKLNLQELSIVDDSIVQWMLRLHPAYVSMREANKARDGQLNELYGLLLEVKPQFLQTSFIPDANSTLRLTSGTVRGYSPADGVINTPVSTFRGVVEKTTGTDPFITPDKVMEAWKTKRFGNYLHPKLNDIPVAILYDADTTGGNSGSPVFNSKGQLVGVNFDRCFEATINDFAWNTNYSRSIGVDIRYVLWITGTVYGAEYLVQEMTRQLHE